MSTVVQFDMDEVVTDFEQMVTRAEQMVTLSGQVRRLGRTLVAVAREVEEEFDQDFRTVGLDPEEVGGKAREVGEQVLAATEIDYDSIELKAITLRALVNWTEGERNRARVETRMRGLALLGRWKRLVEAKELESKGNFDLPFPVKVMRGDSEAVTGEKAGVTYWHNLRAVWQREQGKLSVKDNEAWLEGKRRLGEGEDQVQVDDWWFIRLH